MNISWLTLRDLEYLVTVASTEHFGQAAQKCHVSQPTLSAQIKKIEEFLGVALFERTTRKVTLTEAGKDVAAQARVVLDEAHKILGLLGQIDAPPLSSGLKLGAIASLGPFYIPKFLSPLRKQYSELNLLLREGLTAQLLKDLQEGNLDAVLAARTFDESGFKVYPLFFEPFVVAAPKGHPILGRKTLRPSDLNADQMILLEDGHCLRDQTLDLCPVNRRGNIRQFHATSVETLRHLVASGLGYTLLPQMAQEMAFGKNRLDDLIDYKDFDRASVGREIVLVCRERYPGLQDIEALAKFLKKNAPKETLAL